MQYVIKNCDRIIEYVEPQHYICQRNLVECKDNSTCLLKSIVDRCRNELEKRNAYSVSIHYDFAREILKFVEIKECENE